jgi:hypothetical protein
MAASLANILSILEERDIALGSDDVAWAFERPETKKALTAWANEYLTSETLLTKDELE